MTEVNSIMRIVVLDDYAQAAAGLADWQRLGIPVTFITEHLEGDGLVRAIADADILVLMRERTGFPRTLLERLARLRLIVTAGARNRAIDLEAASELGIKVCGTQTLGHPTAELTWALILAFARHLPFEARALSEGRWQSTIGSSLAGSTLGILGLGRVGSRVARVALAFEMDVLAWSPSLTQERAAAEGAVLASKDELLERSDYVTLHIPLNAGTRGFIGEAELERMKSSACLINTSRSEIVDEDALLEALRAGTIAGAAIDVFPVEPLPAGYPLVSLPSVLATPHLGYVTRDNLALIYSEAVTAIADFLGGQPLARPLN